MGGWVGANVATALCLDPQRGNLEFETPLPHKESVFVKLHKFSTLHEHLYKILM